MRLRDAIPLLALTLSLSAQTKPAFVSGRVVHGATGEPLRKASVSLIPAAEDAAAAPRSVVSAQDGAFQFTDVTPGSYQISAQRAGFLSQRGGPQPGRPTTITVKEGGEVTGVEIRLTPQGVIAGRVVDPDGDPVQGAQISVMRMVSTAGKVSLTPQPGASTNDLGEFRANNLPQGKYLVTATASRRGFGGGFRGGPPGGRSRVPEGEKEDMIVTYFPSSPSSQSATPLDVRAGSEINGVEIRLRRARILQVRGQVIGDLTKRVGLMLLPGEREAAGPGPLQMAQVEKDGSFTFSAVTPGSYQIVAQRMDRRPVMLARAPLLVGSGDIDNVTVRLQEPVTVTGALKFETANNAPMDIGSTRIFLQPAGGASNGFRDESIEGKIAENNAFTFTSVPPDKMIFYPYNLAAGVYLKSVRIGGQELIDTGIDLAVGGPQVQIEAVFATNGGSLSGRVMLDNKPASNYTVTAHPEPPRPFQPWLIKTATTDAAGNFTFRTLPPGDYRILAWEEIAKEFLSDTDFIKRFESSGPKVAIKESGAQSVDLAPVNTTESKQ